MIYQGKAITVKPLEGGIVELNFDLKGESVNKFNRLTLSELRAAVDAIKADASVKGVIVTSGKDVFIVGADITEFVDNFQLPDEELMAGNLEANKIFSDFEDLDVPTVRRDQRHRPRRRPGDVPGRGLPRDERDRQGRPAGSQAGHLPGLRRHRPPAAPDRLR